MRLFSPVRVITLGNKLKERFAPRRFTLLFHQINDEGKWVFLNGPTHTLCYCHVFKALYERKFNAPMLWNSNFFITLESMKILRVLTDVWLPDFKFGPGRCAMVLAKTPWYWETVTRNLGLIAEWGEDYSIHHLVMPNHVQCCTYPVLEWIAEHVPAAPVNVMAQFHPDNFCDPASAKYRNRYAEIARRPSRAELNNSWRHARELGLKFETSTFERCNA